MLKTGEDGFITAHGKKKTDGVPAGEKIISGDEILAYSCVDKLLNSHSAFKQLSHLLLEKLFPTELRRNITLF